MNNTITVTVKTVYGKDLVYPVCHKAKAFAQLAKTQTLPRETINVIKMLGYDIQVQQQIV